MMSASVVRRKRQPKNVAVGIVPIVNNIHAAARPGVEYNRGWGVREGKHYAWERER